jgi:hypothetical protein
MMNAPHSQTPDEMAPKSSRASADPPKSAIGIVPNTNMSAVAARASTRCMVRFEMTRKNE